MNGKLESTDAFTAFLITACIYPWFIALAWARMSPLWAVPATLTVIAFWVFGLALLTARISTMNTKPKEKANDG